MQVYKYNSNRIESIPNIYYQLNQDTDSEIGSIIVISNSNNNRIDLDKSNNNTNCKDKPGNYSIPLLMEE